MNRHTSIFPLVHLVAFNFVVTGLHNDMSIMESSRGTQCHVCLHSYEWNCYNLNQSVECHILCTFMDHITLGLIYMLCVVCFLQ